VYEHVFFCVAVAFTMTVQSAARLRRALGGTSTLNAHATPDKYFLIF